LFEIRSRPCADVRLTFTLAGLLPANRANYFRRISSGEGIRRTAVGDRYVLEHMRAHGCNIGGEPSGQEAHFQVLLDASLHSEHFPEKWQPVRRRKCDQPN
jgi:hypothetical protein